MVFINSEKSVPGTSMTETSGNAFRGTLSRMRHSLRYRHSQPSSVASAEVGTSAGGGTQEQQGQPLVVPSEDNKVVTDSAELEHVSAVVGKDVDDAAQAFDSMVPMPRLGERNVNFVINDANTALTDIPNSSDPYFQPFQDFNQVVTTLSKDHPSAQKI
ncbi:hypothetical protein F5J12DRAFT_331004 [Pisolithus orientalis]|uniref:uncharacterized protein n=1 Tax=Pisolithus orientalis TaxID=936130 RepID=UPI0022256F27|nr:uncharacterized protein F5J12DRAFT_331004 [Pisolithus orientalis]KAI5997869.1 hypothetical protein F5J12DRAFT_331004 [Pisolithus orientalis]